VPPVLPVALPSVPVPVPPEPTATLRRKSGTANVVEPSPAPKVVPMTANRAAYVVRETAVPSQRRYPVGAAANQKAANDLTGGILGAAGQAGMAAVGGANKGGQAVQGGFVGTQGDFTSNQGVMYAEGGGVVPGVPTVPGDHPVNDKVPAMLSPGEVVVPVSKADDPEKTAEFIKTLKAQKKAKGRTGGYGDVLSSQRELHDRLAILEMACGGMVPGMANGGTVQPAPPPTPAMNVQNSFLSNLGAAYLKTRMNRQAGA